jgi:hypothetical protein
MTAILALTTRRKYLWDLGTDGIYNQAPTRSVVAGTGFEPVPPGCEIAPGGRLCRSRHEYVVDLLLLLRFPNARNRLTGWYLGGHHRFV